MMRSSIKKSYIIDKIITKFKNKNKKSESSKIKS